MSTWRSDAELLGIEQSVLVKTFQMGPQEMRARQCRALYDAGRASNERLGCGLDYVEEWGALPDEIAALAFVTPHEVPLPFKSCSVLDLTWPAERRCVAPLCWGNWLEGLPKYYAERRARCVERGGADG